MQEIYTSNEELLLMSLQNFLVQFPDERACLSAFPARCNYCGCLSEPPGEKERSFICSNCRRKSWRTAGTFFHGLETLMPTFAVIWLHEDRVVCSRNEFAEIFGISYSNSWATHARVQSVIDGEMNTKDLFEVVSTHFDPIICKRSIKTTADEHPTFELIEDEQPDSEPEFQCDQQKKLYDLLSAQAASFDYLEGKTGLSTPQFSAALGMLEINGLAVKLPGNMYIRNKSSAASSANVPANADDLVNKFFTYVRNFHGISRKYLQRYIASFWSVEGYNRWHKVTLLKTCMEYGRIRRADILAYTSPHMVQMVHP